MCTSKDLSKISGFLGKRPRRLIFWLQTYLYLRSTHVPRFMYPLFDYACVLNDLAPVSLSLSLSPSLWGRILHITTTSFYRLKGSKKEVWNAYGQFFRPVYLCMIISTSATEMDFCRSFPLAADREKGVYYGSVCQ